MVTQLFFEKYFLFKLILVYPLKLTWLEGKESLLFVLKGGVLTKGGVFFFLCCLGLVLDFGLVGNDSRVSDPSGEDVLLVEVDDDDVLTGGLVTGSRQFSP